MQADPIRITEPFGLFAFTRATLDVGDVRTSYVRAGAGAPVLVLGSIAAPGVLDPVLGALAAHFRVVAPDPFAGAQTSGDAPAPAFSAWLRGLLDGLGLPRASIVAREEYALRALSFCLTDPLRVDRLVLLYCDVADPALGAAASPELLGRTGHPFLVRCESRACGSDAPARPVAEDVTRFLLGAEPA